MHDLIHEKGQITHIGAIEENVRRKKPVMMLRTVCLVSMFCRWYDRDMYQYGMNLVFSENIIQCSNESCVKCSDARGGGYEIICDFVGFEVEYRKNARGCISRE